ncbi:polysaccharide biosynthesis C-terminal domain-containing protein [Enterocloster lavalensis]|uniref:Capsular polysaccharide assembling protein CapF C-terminal domain-containing protein n=1 Tax=Enterocloster lavalensis TaxID=460384 RepID=A0A1I0HXV9_9FIRM|nr:hypothetical protein [Enterocloster lavalensis]SET88147.1 hypothetical protein SAMN05216313_11815 [Enterocloster lavalensis]
MSLIKIITPNFQYEDLRGRLVQLVRTGYCQVNIIESVAGATRGGHYHIQNREAFYVIGGKLKLTVWHLNVGTQKEEYEFSENAMFEIEPYTIHSFEFIEPTMLVSMYSMGVELADGKKDIYTLNS